MDRIWRAAGEGVSGRASVCAVISLQGYNWRARWLWRLAILLDYSPSIEPIYLCTLRPVVPVAAHDAVAKLPLLFARCCCPARCCSCSHQHTHSALHQLRHAFDATDFEVAEHGDAVVGPAEFEAALGCEEG